MKEIKGLFVFVVQKHKATALHYDFRLEIGDVMPSWSIPKGPTLDASVKRLAMRTPDHALDYRNFEGVIPEGSYGAGPVMIWDEGTYSPEVEIEKGVRKEIHDKKEAEKVVKEQLEKGELKFQVYGKKLKGSFALVKTRGFGGKSIRQAQDKSEYWLLIKHKDEFVQEGYNANDYDTSAKSGRMIEEIKE